MVLRDATGHLPVIRYDLERGIYDEEKLQSRRALRDDPATDQEELLACTCHPLHPTE
jgi:hypothetical protein